MSYYHHVSARFLFNNGEERFTVEYTFGISKWFIFVDDKSTDAIFVKEDTSISYGSINNESASEVLHEYLSERTHR